jgi:hypothetical protein
LLKRLRLWKAENAIVSSFAEKAAEERKYSERLCRKGCGRQKMLVSGCAEKVADGRKC